MIVKKMKSVIKYAIELDITYLETFLGYEGDKVLKIITKHEDTLKLLEAYLKNLDLDYKAEYQVSTQQYQLFVGVEDTSIVRLKKI